MTGNPPKVFISYSHDTVVHQERVLGLANRLRADGIDAEIDQYNASPPEGWPLWCERQIEGADFVLMVCTETYHRRVRGDEEQGKGLGVVWEARIIRQRIYDAGAVSEKFVPVLFSDSSPDHIPTPIKGGTQYVIDTEEDYEEIYRRLTGQSRLRPELGPIRPMPTRRRQWSEGTMQAAASSLPSAPDNRRQLLEVPADSSPALKALRNQIYRFGEKHPASRRAYKQGDIVIRQGDASEECYLIKKGVVRILVKDHASGIETQVALRFEGSLIGETAFFDVHSPRTATVQVASALADLISLARNDLFSLIAEDPSIRPAIELIAGLAQFRQHETSQVLHGRITTTPRLMSALIADMHNFSFLSELVWEEQSSAFLFDFMEYSEDISALRNAEFYDQGDGFKILFHGRDYPKHAVSCAVEIAGFFDKLGSKWARANNAFANVGLGIGICSDIMFERRRESSPRPKGRVIAHAINVAAAMTKTRMSMKDIRIFLDQNTRMSIVGEEYAIGLPDDILLEKIGKLQKIYEVRYSKCLLRDEANLEEKAGYMTP